MICTPNVDGICTVCGRNIGLGGRIIDLGSEIIPEMYTAVIVSTEWLEDKFQQNPISVGDSILFAGIYGDGYGVWW